MSDLQHLPIDHLQPHPDNPRLQFREDIVGQIAGEMGERGFGWEHAILVRPYGDSYQIVSGHHRLEAAKRAGLTEVPCWVRDMDDDEAFMQLVLANAQGELTRLEYGVHALRAIPAAEGGRGKRGGIREYAERVGRDESNIRKEKAAAEVVINCGNITAVYDKAYHLTEISKAPQETWFALVQALAEKGWSVKDTASHVEQVKRFEVGDLTYAEDWLPITEVVERYLAAPERFTPRTVARLVTAASDVEDWIEANAPDRLHEFLSWLTENRGGDSWDHRAIIAFHQRLLAEQWEVTGWHHGDWRDHLDELGDGSVSLVLTDPPYGVAYRSGYRAEQHERITNDGDTETATAEIREALLKLHPKLADDAHVLVFCTWRTEEATKRAIQDAGYTIRGSVVWAKNNTSMGDLDATFAPKHERILHAAKGAAKLLHRSPDVIEASRVSSDRHPTEKPLTLLTELIEATTSAGQIAADPFAGVGSTCVAAKETGRKWWGCELNEDYWRAGEERLS